MTTQALRSSVQALASRADRDLSALWRAVDTAAKAHVALNDVLPALVQQYGMAAAAIAAIWYDDQRAKSDAPGTFSAVPVDLGTAGADALAGFGTAAVARHEGGVEAARVLVSGGLQRRIANYARQTIVTTSIADPGAQGWVRVGVGECSWCAKYLDGEVHYVEGYDFDAHDHCKCYAAPAW